MIQLIKRDLMLNKYPELFLIVLGIPLSYYAGMPSIFYMLYFLFPVLAINLFYYDDKFNMNRFVIALPISKKEIVRSRYLYLLSLHTATLIYLWTVSLFNTQLLSEVVYLNFTWKEVIVVLSGFTILTAIIIPCYYMIRSFSIATVVIVILIYSSLFMSIPLLASGLGMEDWFVLNQLDQGYVPILEAYFFDLPYLTLLIIAGILLFLSLKISQWLFTRQDH